MDATHNSGGARRHTFTLLCLIALIATSLSISVPERIYADGNGDDTLQAIDSSGVGKSLLPPSGAPGSPDLKWGLSLVELTSVLVVTGW